MKVKLTKQSEELIKRLAAKINRQAFVSKDGIWNKEDTLQSCFLAILESRACKGNVLDEIRVFRKRLSPRQRHAFLYHRSDITPVIGEERSDDPDSIVKVKK